GGLHGGLAVWRQRRRRPFRYLVARRCGLRRHNGPCGADRRGHGRHLAADGPADAEGDGMSAPAHSSALAWRVARFIARAAMVLVVTAAAVICLGFAWF